MAGWVVGVLAKSLAAVLCLAAAIWLALWYFIPAPPSTIVIMAGIKGGAFEHIAQRYRERLARQRVTLDLRFTEGPIDNLRHLDDRSSGFDASFVFGGVADAQQSPEVMSLGRIAYNPFWFFYRGPETLDRLTQLKGKRVGANFTNPIINQIFNANGVNPDSATVLQVSGPALVKPLKDGEVDVIIIPGEPNSPLIQSLIRDPNVRLMSLAQAEAMTRVFPYLNRLVLPQGVIDLERNIPASDVSLIARTAAVVVRKDLHPELVYLLAQTLAEEHAGAGIFHRAGDFPTQTDPEFPMAEEAREFYKNGPSLLQRYLPFWMINFTKRMIAVLLTGIAIVIPLLSLAPRLYLWFLKAYMAKIYRRLRGLETQLQAELTAPQVAALQTDLENIDRAVNFVPMRHSDMFLVVKGHIDRTRIRLASRLVELRG
jgi:TRAP-type uncharacterized transport system substrate-binding protein